MLSRRAGLLLLVLGSILLPWISFSTPVTHALTPAQAISVQARSYTVHFPGSIDFYETVNDAANTLQRATLSLNIGPEQNQEQQNVQISPGQHSAALHWHEDTSGSRFLPPGTPITYSWQIWDTAGNTLTDTSQTLTTTDTRFQWQHLNQGLLQVNWYGKGQNFGQMLLNQAGISVDHVTSELGGGLKHPLNLWVYGTDTDFHGSLAPGSYEWVGGEALPALNEASIVVATPSDYTLVRDMPHELTHLVFHQLIEHGLYPPTWFDEGLAVYNQLFHESEMLARFNAALSTNTLLRLDALDKGFPADSDKALEAYSQSWQLVAYMYNTFGHEKMVKLVQNLGNANNSFDSALQQSIGEDHLRLENQWRVSLHQPAVLTPAELTPTATTRSTSGTTGTVQSGSNVALWIVGGLAVIILLEGCVLALWLQSRKRRRMQPVPVQPLYPADWNQFPQAAQGQWPGGYPPHTPPTGMYPGAPMPGAYPPRPEMYAQAPVPGAYPPPPEMYAQAPVPRRVPQE